MVWKLVEELRKKMVVNVAQMWEVDTKGEKDSLNFIDLL